MGDLRALIRFHRWQLDEKQRVLAELYNNEEQILSEAAQLEESIKAEQRLARDHFEISFGYAGFAQAALGRRARFAQALEDIRVQIAKASDDLAETYQDVKRYELAQEERVRQDKEKQRHKENEMLDETAMTGFRRRQQDEQNHDS